MTFAESAVDRELLRKLQAYPELSEKDSIKIIPIVLFATGRNFRGADTWPGSYIFPAAGFEFLGCISIAKGLHYFYSTPTEKFKVGADFYDDSEPLIRLTEHKKDYRNRREFSYGVFVNYEYRMTKYASWSVGFHRDIKAFNGSYYIFRLRFPILPLISLGGEAAWADRKANEYAYGPGALSGRAHYDAYLSAFLPFVLPWKGKLILTYTISQIAQTHNKDRDYVRGRGTQRLFSSIALWTL